MIGKVCKCLRGSGGSSIRRGVPAPPPAVFKATVSQRFLQAMSTLQPLANYSAVLAHDLPWADSSTACSTF